MTKRVVYISVELITSNQNHLQIRLCGATFTLHWNLFVPLGNWDHNSKVTFATLKCHLLKSITTRSLPHSVNVAWWALLMFTSWKINLSSICTGCAIKNGTHSFNYTPSHDRNLSNLKLTFICFYTELSFEVYNSCLGQLA